MIGKRDEQKVIRYEAILREHQPGASDQLITAFLQHMEGKEYGESPLLNAFAWFWDGWVARIEARQAASRRIYPKVANAALAAAPNAVGQGQGRDASALPEASAISDAHAPATAAPHEFIKALGAWSTECEICGKSFDEHRETVPIAAGQEPASGKPLNAVQDSKSDPAPAAPAKEKP